MDNMRLFIALRQIPRYWAHDETLCLIRNTEATFLSLPPTSILMPPAQSFKAKASESTSRPKKASKSKKVHRRRKIPKSLIGIPLQHYGVNLNDFNDEFNNVDATDTVDLSSGYQPSTIFNSQIPVSNQNRLRLASDPVQVPASPEHPIPLPTPIPRCPVNATRITPHYGTDLYPFFQNELEGYYSLDSTVENILSMANNPGQSYGRYISSHSHQQTNGLLPSSNLVQSYDGDWYWPQGSASSTTLLFPGIFPSNSSIEFSHTYNEMPCVETAAGAHWPLTLFAQANDETEFSSGPFINDSATYH